MCSFCYSQSYPPVFENARSVEWSGRIFERLSYEEKIGQLFMVDAYSNRDSIHVNAITDLITNYHIGGVIFFQGGPLREANLTNYYQSIAKVPLLIGIDGEWGLSMRLDSTIRYPRQMTLGATGNDSLIYRMAYEIGRQCKRMGIHLNFAPVADINNNPLNPVISSRSFGESKERVTAGSLLYLKGLQDQNVMACGKHFPGHGNTDTDSHFSLPVLNHSGEEMDSVELYPFRELIKNGVASMMVAHLYIPAYDTINNLAATLSKNITTTLLKEKMGYNGLIFTDALNMKGVADFYPSGELELKALLAGNDVLLYSSNVPEAWNRIHLAIQNCEIDQEFIDEKVKKILMAKYWTGATVRTVVDTVNLINDLNNAVAEYITRELYENAITLISNDDKLIPFANLDNDSLASVVINDSINNPFQEMLKNYREISVFRMSKDPSVEQMDTLVKILSQFKHVILSVHNTSTKSTSGYGISDKTGELITKLKEKVKLVTVVFGNAYTLTRIPGSSEKGTLVLAYEDTYWPQYYTAQALFGAAHFNGKIPVTPGNGIKSGTGIPFNEPYTRLRFTSPLEMGIAPERLAVIDTIVNRVISEHAAPGCQVLVSWKGNIIHQKSYGTFDYSDSSRKVVNTDLYDIASVTKIAATALAVMKLYEKGEIDISKKASRYLHELKKTNKKDLIISDILLHQAGLKSWIPFWKQTLDNGKLSYNFYHPVKDLNYSIKLTDSLYLLNSYPEKLWSEILSSPVGEKGKYEYSDLGMLIMQKIIEEVTDKSLDEYLKEEFYEPLGLHRLQFNPPVSELPHIVPTENDTVFRKALVHGIVHDPAAAMLGGVAGNAGLFSDAGSLAVIMQMLTNNGTYGGKKYFNPETVALFTSRFQNEGTNRRGLIFDKPEIERTKNGPTAISASPATFGHTGFTGTAAWADPVNDLVYVFLSNRVHPDSGNNRLAQGNFRTDIMQAVYDIIRNPVLLKPR